MDDLRNPTIVLFALVAAAHLVALGFEIGPLAFLTKCALAPLLAFWILQNNGPTILVLALTACFFGDLFLEFNNDVWFLIGMGAFAVAHIAFVTYFAQDGAFGRLVERWWIAAALLAIAVVVFAFILAKLDLVLQIAVPIYALLLITTASLALVTDVRVGIGALLFLFSDTLIALRIAEVVDRNSTTASLVVMATYITAIFLLATGLTAHAADASTPDSTSTHTNGTTVPETT